MSNFEQLLDQYMDRKILSIQEIMNSIPNDALNTPDDTNAQIKTEIRWRFLSIYPMVLLN